ncbi:sialidase family protein [Pedobacter sp. MW01-1-1]|uniref:sialidase family protein n=1 Tax=Pedobacter sp. MW01-1-1 TaxID=3383027 RepID=UPI003FED805C
MSCKKKSKIEEEIALAKPAIDVITKGDSIKGDSIKMISFDPEPDDIGSAIVDLEGELLVNQTGITKFTARSWQGIPSIQISEGGVLFLVWYTGGPDEEPGNYLTLSVSKNKGLTWTKNALIVNPTKSNVRFFDPVLWKDKFGNVFLSWSKCKDSKWDGKGGVWYSKIDYVEDRITTTTPRWLSDGVMMNKPSLSFDKNITYYPVAFWGQSFGTSVYQSTSNEVFKKAVNFKKISAINIQASIRTFDEHSIIQLADSSFIAMMRTTDGIYSAKANKTQLWSNPQKFTQLGATTASRFFLNRLTSGRIALIINNSTSRNNLKIFLSDDEAKTWKYSMMIDSREGVSYPDLTEAADGTLYVTYDRDRYGAQEIHCVSFNENDVITNNTANIKRYIVDKK